MKYGGDTQGTFPNGHQGFPQQQSGSSFDSLKDMVLALGTSSLALQESTTRFQEETTKNFERVGNQIVQLQTAVSRMENQMRGVLPSQPEPNPNNLRNVSAVQAIASPSIEDDEAGEEVLEKEEISTSKAKVTFNPPLVTFKNLPPPFPSRLARPKVDKEADILEIFRKVVVNIPLLDAIKHVPKYAKVLKELCTNKRKLRGDEKVEVSENVSAIFRKKIAPKLGDPGMFTIPCKIGNSIIDRALIDLGASINLMPKSLYASLNLGPLRETRVVVQLADRTKAYPEGVVENVLVQVGGLIFPADFYVFDMKDEPSRCSVPLILGRPFLSTSDATIHVRHGSLTMEFDGEKVHFNMFDSNDSKLPSSTPFATNALLVGEVGMKEFCGGQHGILLQGSALSSARDGGDVISRRHDPP